MTGTILLCLAAAVVAAADKKQPESPSERVEVRATTAGAEDAAAFATTIDATEARARGENLADLLRRVPGARVREYGGLGSYATVSLRASTAEQVVILVDGIPQNRALGGPVDLASIPTTQIESVTVFRGFAPAAYGLGGIGGLVDVRTVRPDRAQANVDLVAGELDTIRLSGGATLRTDRRGWLRVGLETLSSDGDFAYRDTRGTLFNPDDDVDIRRRNNDVDQRRIVLDHSREQIWGGDLRVHLRMQDDERGVPGVDGRPSTTARLDDERVDLNGTWRWQGDTVLRNLDVLIDGFSQSIDFVDPEGNVGLATQDQTTDMDGAGVATVAHVDAGRHSLLLRADYRYERVAVTERQLPESDRGGAKRNRYSLTVEDTLVFGRITIAPSLRWEQRDDDFVDSSNAAVPSATVREDDLAGKLAFAWTRNDRFAVRGSAGSFFRSPNLLELFGDRGAVTGNPRLRSERGASVELGVVHRSKSVKSDGAFGWEWDAVGFARDVDDLIVFEQRSQGGAVPRNVDAVEVFGIETSGALAWRRGLRLQAGVTWQQARNASDGFADGQPVGAQPKWLGFAGVAYGDDRWQLRWDVTYTGENPTTAIDIAEFRIPGRFIHDAYVGYTLSSRWRVGLDVHNVFDLKTRDLFRYPLPDRVILLSLGWQSEPTR